MTRLLYLRPHEERHSKVAAPSARGQIALRPTDGRVPQPLAGMALYGWSVGSIPLYELDAARLAETDVLYLPGTHDQLFLASIGETLVRFLGRGGHFVVNAHVAVPWLPMLARFAAVPPRPHTNLMIRPHDPGPYFGRMDYDTFHLHEGLLGQYARGYSTPPEGAQWLSMIGAPGDLHPVDWVWRFPGGGRLFLHAGDNVHAFCSGSISPDRPGEKPNLTHDILRAIAA